MVTIAKKNRLLTEGSMNYAWDKEGQLSTAGGTTFTFDYDHRLVGHNPKSH